MVIGKICMEHIAVRTEHGVTVRLRISPSAGAQLRLGQQVQLVIGESGRPERIGDFPARFVTEDVASSVGPAERIATRQGE